MYKFVSVPMNEYERGYILKYHDYFNRVLKSETIFPSKNYTV